MLLVIKKHTIMLVIKESSQSWNLSRSNQLLQYLDWQARSLLITRPPALCPYMLVVAIKLTVNVCRGLKV